MSVTGASPSRGGPPLARYMRSGVLAFELVVWHPKKVGRVDRFCAVNSSNDVGTGGKE